MPLDGYPFHIQGTKKEITDFLDEYAKKGFYFNAKSINQSAPKVVVNIKLCLIEYNPKDIVKNFFKDIVKETIGKTAFASVVGIIEPFIENFKYQSFLNTYKMIDTNKKKEILRKAVNKITEEIRKKGG
ncbi:hypothetical protein [Endozoicomonas sp. YOMI1]|uniref:hypothetical protein n=1 Tax=Endozoicomonas sp. YOMI1 TaxID=2828739 RepID=UPI00214762FF|nr:hypothetical protein [Endozoicomonas sp. YOMI1]